MIQYRIAVSQYDIVYDIVYYIVCDIVFDICVEFLLSS